MCSLGERLAPWLGSEVNDKVLTAQSSLPARVLRGLGAGAPSGTSAAGVLAQASRPPGGGRTPLLAGWLQQSNPDFYFPEHLMNYALFSKHWRNKGSWDSTPRCRLEGRQSHIQVMSGWCDGNCSSRKKGQTELGLGRQGRQHRGGNI